MSDNGRMAVVGILLAAGRSQRYGADKRWQPLTDGTPMALRAAGALRAACDHVIVVLRSGDEDLALACRQAGSIAGLAAVFRRWRNEVPSIATDDDRRLVEEALARTDDGRDG